MGEGVQMLFFLLSLLVFYVTCNDILVICDGTDVQAD